MRPRRRQQPRRRAQRPRPRLLASPQVLQDKYQGFIGPQIVQDFTYYAGVLFEAFGDRVKDWMTFNECAHSGDGGLLGGALRARPRPRVPVRVRAWGHPFARTDAPARACPRAPGPTSCATCTTATASSRRVRARRAAARCPSCALPAAAALRRACLPAPRAPQQTGGSSPPPPGPRLARAGIVYGDKGQYACGHHLLLAHASAARLFSERYKPRQRGRLGMAINSYWWEPLTRSAADVRAAQNALDQDYGARGAAAAAACVQRSSSPLPATRRPRRLPPMSARKGTPAPFHTTHTHTGPHAHTTALPARRLVCGPPLPGGLPRVPKGAQECGAAGLHSRAEGGLQKVPPRLPGGQLLHGQVRVVCVCVCAGGKIVSDTCGYVRGAVH